MAHRRVLANGSAKVLSVLLLVNFIAILSSITVVNALPQILTDLQGSHSQFTLVISSTLVTMAATMPIWGKLADVRNKKRLLQVAICIFTSGSMLCGMASSIPMLIAFRAWQGIGLGGILALIQIVIAAIIPARQRGKYFGYFAAAQAVATIGGPLFGGLIVDSPLGWRWIFYIVVPFAVVALVLLHFILRLPDDHRSVRIDYLGSVLVTCSVGLLLVWISMAGGSFPWTSWTSGAILAAAILASALTALAESRAPDPVLPFRVAGQRTIGLLMLGGIALGVCGFSVAAFSVQYLFVGRSYSASDTGMLSMPGMASILISTTISGRVITRYGRWQRILVVGSAFNLASFVMLSFLNEHTSMLFFETGLVLNGVAFGMLLQTLILGAQNTVADEDVGAATGIVSSIRLLGGALGLSVIGATIGASTVRSVSDGLQTTGHRFRWSGEDFDFSTMPPDVAEMIRQAYCDAVGHGMRVCVAFALLGLVAAAFIRETPLRTSVSREVERADEGQGVRAQDLTPGT